MPVFLLCILLLIMLLKHRLNSLDHQEQQENEDFWSKEKKASLPIKKSMDDLVFLTIPVDQLPFHNDTDAKLVAMQNTILELSQQKVCNLSGISNTDLKLKYGARNLGELSEYDQNYTILLRTLADWSARLFELGYDEDALTVANYALDCKTDVSKTYSTLARIYKKRGQLDQLYALIPIAESASTMIDLKKVIYDVLNEY